MIFGKGINDLSCTVDSYSTWHSIHRRCYSQVYQKTKPTYVGCVVDADWHKLSVFDKWFQVNFVEGWQLDKDLLQVSSKVYSEDSCCFLPPELNTLIVEKAKEDGLPPGVSYKAKNSKFVAQLSQYKAGVRASGHLCLHEDPEVCFQVYKEAKERKIKELATAYKSTLTARAHEALLNFEVLR